MHGIFTPGSQDWEKIKFEIETEMMAHAAGGLLHNRSTMAESYTGYDRWIEATLFYLNAAKEKCGRYFTCVASATMGILVVKEESRVHYRSEDAKANLDFFEGSCEELKPNVGAVHFFRFFLATKKIALESLYDLIHDYPEIKASLKKRKDYKEFEKFVMDNSLFPKNVKPVLKILEEKGEDFFGPRVTNSLHLVTDQHSPIEVTGWQTTFEFDPALAQGSSDNGCHLADHS